MVPVREEKVHTIISAPVSFDDGRFSHSFQGQYFDVPTRVELQPMYNLPTYYVRYAWIRVRFTLSGLDPVIGVGSCEVLGSQDAILHNVRW